MTAWHCSRLDRFFAGACGLMLALALPLSFSANAQVNKPGAAKPRSGQAAASGALAKTDKPSAAMVVAGDREAPLVLSIIPWAEPRMSALPEAPVVQLLPSVLDSDAGIFDAAVRRSSAKP